MNKNFMRDQSKDEYGLVELQNKILEIMVYIDSVCKANNIVYYLMGGSALGAKRHDGFIPWDDDLDIFMTPTNYEKFRNIFKKLEDKEKYYLQEWGRNNGLVTVPKLRMNNTTYIEKNLKNWNIHQGIYVDIFILHNCSDNIFGKLWQFFWAKYAITKGMSMRNYHRALGIKKVFLMISKILPENFLIEFALNQVYRYRDIDTKNFCNFMGKAVFKKGIYKKKWFGNGKYKKFENIELKVPNDLENFLGQRFGNYMVIPSKERIKWEQHAEFWDTKKDFKEYIHIKNFNDERKLI